MVAHPKSERAKKQKARRKREKAKKSREPHVAGRPDAGGVREKKISGRQLRKRKARRREKLVAVAIILPIGLLGWLALKPGPELPGVERPSNDGRGHIVGATYAEAAPTSGRHNGSAPGCGLYQTPLAADQAVHALEHGTVVFWYDSARSDLADELTGVLDEFDSHVIVSPNENLDAPIVATAWNRRLELDDVGETARAFAETYRRRGPESVACDLAS